VTGMAFDGIAGWLAGHGLQPVRSLHLHSIGLQP
jgi:hypothetical protein